MDTLSEIKESIKKIASTGGMFRAFTAKVKSVNGETCTVELEGLTLTDVRLRAVVNGENSKILVTPKTDSYVLVVDLAGDLSQLAVVGYSEVEKIEVDTDKIIFNGGNNNGLVKIKKLTQKLNAIEQDLNALKSIFTSWAPVPQDGGAELKASAETWAASQLQITQISDYEDTNITH